MIDDEVTDSSSSSTKWRVAALRSQWARWTSSRVRRWPNGTCLSRQPARLHNTAITIQLLTSERSSDAACPDTQKLLLSVSDTHDILLSVSSVMLSVNRFSTAVTTHQRPVMYRRQNCCISECSKSIWRPGSAWTRSHSSSRPPSCLQGVGPWWKEKEARCQRKQWNCTVYLRVCRLLSATWWRCARTRLRDFQPATHTTL